MFRIVGDCFHGLAIVILLWKIYLRKSCIGISGRSQLLFAIVYVSRYSDMWMGGPALSDVITVMKCFFITASFLLLFLIFILYRETYQHEKDTFPTEVLLFPCFILGLLYTTASYSVYVPTHALWVSSLLLEALAILPQLSMIYKSKQMEKVILYYLVAMSIYRSMYIVDWLYRLLVDGHYGFIEPNVGIGYTLIYIAMVIVFWRTGVTITEEASKANLRSNIFLISSNGEFMDSSNLMGDPIITEKNAAKDLEKFEKA